MDAEAADPAEEVSRQLLPCSVCSRTFVLASLRKHEKICEKNAVKRRKPFNSLKQRVEGTDIAPFHQKVYVKRPEPAPEPPKKRKTWKEKHLELLNSIREAKGISPPKETNMPKTSSLLADTERCPSCERQFGPKAYDRHVEWCKEKKANQRLHQSPANVLLAKERLEARIKYQPPLHRNKKTPVKDKYSSSANSTRTESTTSLVSQGSVRAKDKKTYLERSKARTVLNKRDGIKVQKPEEVSNREAMGVLSSPSLTSDSMKSTPATDPYNVAQLQLMELLNCDDFRSISPITTHYNNTKQAPVERTSTPIPTLNYTRSKRNNKDSLESLTDEFELMESLIEENFKEADVRSVISSLNGKQHHVDDTSLIDPSLINENDDLSLPENFKLSEDSPTSPAPAARKRTPEPPKKLINATQHNKITPSKVTKRTPAIAKPIRKITPTVVAKASVQRKPGVVKAKDNKMALIRSISSVSSEKSVCSEKESAKKTKPTTVDKWLEESNEKEPLFKPEELFSVDDAMYEEFKKYEEMYLKERKQRNSSKKNKAKLIEINYKILAPSEDPVNNKVASDSAYGSLTRSTPERGAKTLNLCALMEPKNLDTPIIDEYVQRSPLSSPVLPKSQQLAKFCHECGNKYPVATAKFCIECGVRRLIL